MHERIEIPLSKLKIGFLFVGAIVFVVFGLLLITNPVQWAIPGLAPAALVRIVGLISTLYFAFIGYFIGQKLFDKEMGLTIDAEGITDNSSATGAGLVEWDDITGFQVAQTYSTKILLLNTDSPDKYIKRAKSKVFKQSMRMNNKLYGSPIGINSTSLNIDFGELEKLIADKLRDRQAGKLGYRDADTTQKPVYGMKILG